MQDVQAAIQGQPEVVVGPARVNFERAGGLQTNNSEKVRVNRCHQGQTDAVSKQTESPGDPEIQQSKCVMQIHQELEFAGPDGNSAGAARANEADEIEAPFKDHNSVRSG